MKSLTGEIGRLLADDDGGRRGVMKVYYWPSMDIIVQHLDVIYGQDWFFTGESLRTDIPLSELTLIGEL